MFKDINGVKYLNTNRLKFLNFNFIKLRIQEKEKASHFVFKCQLWKTRVSSNRALGRQKTHKYLKSTTCIHTLPKH